MFQSLNDLHGPLLDLIMRSLLSTSTCTLCLPVWSTTFSLDRGSSYPSLIVPSLKLSLSVWPACWQSSFLTTNKVSGSFLFLAVLNYQQVSHGHRNWNPAADTRCTTRCWPAGRVHFFSSPSPSPSGLRRHHLDHHAIDCHLQSQVVMLDMLQVFSSTSIGAHTKKQQGSAVACGLDKPWHSSHPPARSKCPPTTRQVGSWGPPSPAAKTLLSIATLSWCYHVAQSQLAHMMHWRELPIPHSSLPICMWCRSHARPVQEVTSFQPSSSWKSPFLNLISADYPLPLQYRWGSRPLEKVQSNSFSSSIPFSFFGYKFKTNHRCENTFFHFDVVMKANSIKSH